MLEFWSCPANTSTVLSCPASMILFSLSTPRGDPDVSDCAMRAKLLTLQQMAHGTRMDECTAKRVVWVIVQEEAQTVRKESLIA